MQEMHIVAQLHLLLLYGFDSVLTREGRSLQYYCKWGVSDCRRIDFSSGTLIFPETGIGKAHARIVSKQYGISLAKRCMRELSAMAFQRGHRELHGT